MRKVYQYCEERLCLVECGFKALVDGARVENVVTGVRWKPQLRPYGSEPPDVVTSSRGRCPTDACTTPLYRLTVARKLKACAATHIMCTIPYITRSLHVYYTRF